MAKKKQVKKTNKITQKSTAKKSTKQKAPAKRFVAKKSAAKKSVMKKKAVAVKSKSAVQGKPAVQGKHIKLAAPPIMKQKDKLEPVNASKLDPAANETVHEDHTIPIVGICLGWLVPVLGFVLGLIALLKRKPSKTTIILGAISIVESLLFGYLWGGFMVAKFFIV